MKIIVEADSVGQLVSIVERISGVKSGVANFRVEDLPLSNRTKNCLLAEGIKTLDDILVMPKRGLLNLPNFGKVSADEVRVVVEMAMLFRGKP